MSCPTPGTTGRHCDSFGCDLPTEKDMIKKTDVNKINITTILGGLDLYNILTTIKKIFVYIQHQYVSHRTKHIVS